MGDVLVVSAPVPGRYASVNHLGSGAHRGGKKTPEYHDLFNAVVAAAEAEMQRVAWRIADYPCAVAITLYHRNGIFPDALNIGKCEFDALTAAGVWIDDKYGRPATADTELDPDGDPRVVIVIRRRFPPYVPKASALVVAARAKRSTRIEAPVTVAPIATVDGRLDYVEVDGKRVPRADFLRDWRAGKLKPR